MIGGGFTRGYFYGVPPKRCDYYASPTGTVGASGLTQSTPTTISHFTTGGLASAGKTLCLMNGTYQGPDYMITPTPGLNGTSSNPITIRALNDGGAVIDGQFTRRPVRLLNNSWWRLEGFNAKQDGSDAVIYLFNGANNNILRRIVAWDARSDTNSIIISIDTATGNLLEDVATFGSGGRQIALGFGLLPPVPRNTCRRCWARYEGCVSQVYSQTFSLAYGGYQGATCENCLSTNLLISLPSNYFLTNSDGRKQTPANGNCSYQAVFGGNCPQVVNNYSLLFLGALYTSTDINACVGSKLLGSLGYITSTSFGTADVGHLLEFYATCLEVKHSLAFMSSGHPRYTQKHGFNAQASTPTSTADHITSIRSNTAGDIFNAAWTVTNNATSETLAGLAGSANPFTGSTGAQLCNKWVNEAVTSIPLWPWPMNERIKAATGGAGNTFANGNPGCGPNSGDCAAAGAGSSPYGTSTRTATDVTAEIESILGTIPASCRRP